MYRSWDGETMLDYLYGPNVVTREAEGSESEKRCNLKRVSQKEWVEDSTLLALKMVEGASSPGMYVTSRFWKRQRNGFFLRIPGGNKALFQPTEDQKTSDFQNCKVIKLCVTMFVNLLQQQETNAHNQLRFASRFLCTACAFNHKGTYLSGITATGKQSIYQNGLPYRDLWCYLIDHWSWCLWNKQQITKAFLICVRITGILSNCQNLHQVRAPWITHLPLKYM